MNGTCCIDGCERNARSRGLCDMHYHKARNHGRLDLYDPTPHVVTSVAERLAARLVRMPTGCLEWTGPRLPAGYGHLNVNGEFVYTHRLAWSLVHGPIPDGMYVCHRCDNPPCCEITHLWIGTPSNNSADRNAKGRHGNRKQSLD